MSLALPNNPCGHNVHKLKQMLSFATSGNKYKKGKRLPKTSPLLMTDVRFSRTQDMWF